VYPAVARGVRFAAPLATIAASSGTPRGSTISVSNETLPDGRPVLWRWRALCAALGAAETDGPDVAGISIDSRTTQPGDLFVALTGDPGARFNASYRSDRDGHDFVDHAASRGAVGALTHDGRARPLPQIQLGDTLDGLWALGRAGRARLHGPVVAVTGSSGKTTLKSFLAAALNAFATEGSLNNHLGVPLSLARTPADAPAAVFELGTNHPGEIGPLSELVRPTVAVVLNVLPVHREHFADLAAIRREKLSIANGLPAGGVLVLEDGIEAAGLPAGLAVRRFGRRADADVVLLEVSGARARFRVADRELDAAVPGGGEHRALTLAAVLCVMAVLGRPLEAALSLPESLVPAGRGRRHLAGGVTVIDDSYNANPRSVEAALRGLAGQPGRRRFALLGEMRELGPDSAAFHRGLAPFTDRLDGVICVGAGMDALYEVLPAERALGRYAEADEALLDALLTVLRAGDVLLIKGSNRVFWTRGFAARLLERLGAGEAAAASAPGNEPGKKMPGL
jgi:UDP-N-acetylmuramoyl-tripeptide--D-alanyl-D-alanine ligase